MPEFIPVVTSRGEQQQQAVCVRVSFGTHQLSDRHLAQVAQTQVRLVPVDFVLQVQRFAAFTHSDVCAETRRVETSKEKT